MAPHYSAGAATAGASPVNPPRDQIQIKIQIKVQIKIPLAPVCRGEGTGGEVISRVGCGPMDDAARVGMTG
jgi:hypothetical protein